MRKDPSGRDSTGREKIASSTQSFLPGSVSDLVEQLGLIPHPEGGFFKETHRSGSTPMTSRGQTDFDVEPQSLVQTTGRENNRPDNNNKRNCLTSIFWVPNAESPIQPLVANVSDHVHYYQGGLPFQYHIYNPTKKTPVRSVTLGPDISNGQVLQIPVVTGEWKCGRLLLDDTRGIEADYSLIAEAVGPGFDHYDFHYVQEEELVNSQPSDEVLEQLKPFIYQPKTTKDEEFDEAYDE